MMTDELKIMILFGPASLWRRVFAGRKPDDVYWRILYGAYLESTAWKRKRLKVLERSGGLCESCGASAVQIHHLTYNRLGDEQLTDLQALCLICHKSRH